MLLRNLAVLATALFTGCDVRFPGRASRAAPVLERDRPGAVAAELPARYGDAGLAGDRGLAA
jgi:hypothetical protein